MTQVITPHQRQIAEVGLPMAEAPACLTTTLYEVMAALHTIVEPDEDELAVAVVVQWLRSRRLTFVRDVTVAA